MRKLKKHAAFLLAAAMVLTGVTACSNKQSDSDATKDSSEIQESADPETDKPEGEENGAEEGGALSGTVREELTALEVVDLMGNGINLGNTMEAIPGTSGTPSVLACETAWGQPVTTQEMITAMKEAGFDTLRIPVAWTNAMEYETGDYTIGEDYLDRIEEIVNYALNEEMYVIINDHWDSGWWGMFGSATPATQEAAMEMYVSMWTQIAERFKDYSDYLIFEGANEELGDRLNDTDNALAADSGTLSQNECYEWTNKINQTFVDTVRATGGNNEQRFLMIAGYNTDFTMTCDDRFEMPSDTAENKLLLSVHYYTPWSYCGAGASSWGTESEYNEMNTLFGMLTKFTEQGYGVVIGEYAVLFNTTMKENTDIYTENLLNNCDLYGYCPVLWDCNNLLSKSELKMIDDTMAEIYLNHSYNAQKDMTKEEIQAAAQQALDDALTAAGGAAPVNDLDTDGAIAWIMYNSSDYTVTYSVGDEYAPTSTTSGLVPTDVQVTGEGEYTVSLDFTGVSGGYASGAAFMALGISNGETLFPGYIITIEKVEVNGSVITLTGDPYTTSDDGLCTRVNFYNEWVGSVPADARIAGGDLSNASAQIVDNGLLNRMETISITFTYAPAE